MSRRHHHHHRHSPSSTFPSCFRPSTTKTTALRLPPPSPPPPPPMSGHPNLTTCLYHTDLALFSLTWSRSYLGCSLYLTLHHQSFDSPPPPLSSSSSSYPSLHLHIKPFLFWKKHGSKKLSPNIRIFWDLSKARFASGPEPQTGFYIAVVVDGHMNLLVGDLTGEAYAKTRAHKPNTPQTPILKREHVVAKNIYATRARLGGKLREIQIDCGCGNDLSRLCFSVDGQRVLQIKRLQWKFRGNERVELDGTSFQISWDVYNWLFENESDGGDGHVVFMFRFEEDEEVGKESGVNNNCPLGNLSSWNFGMSGIEWRKMGKSLSSSSVSMSSAGSSVGSSSVMEWANMEESELSGGPSGFSLLVYAWKR